MVIFAKSQDSPGCKMFNKLKLMNVSCQGIAPNWGAIKQPDKTKLLMINKSVSLSSNCLILLIWISLFIQLGSVLRICSSWERHWSKNTPTSFATGVGVIVKSGTCRSNCGTPMTRSLVLSGFISSELWQRHLQISFTSELNAETVSHSSLVEFHVKFRIIIVISSLTKSRYS